MRLMNQAMLFAPTTTQCSDARLSTCGRYRYWLLRPLGAGPTALFCMLNPSTADAKVDDPTIRRCIGFAKAWGCGALEVVNLFAWRATDPSVVIAAFRRGEDIVGPDNDEAIIDAARRAGIVIAAWGGEPIAANRGNHVMKLLSRVADVHCLARTEAGAPRHPLYLKATLRPVLLQAKDIRNG